MGNEDTRIRRPLLRMTPQRARDILAGAVDCSISEYGGERTEADEALKVFDELVKNQLPVSTYVSLRDAAICLCHDTVPCDEVLNWIASNIAIRLPLFTLANGPYAPSSVDLYPTTHRMHGGGDRLDHFLYPSPESSYTNLAVRRDAFMKFVEEIESKKDGETQ